MRRDGSAAMSARSKRSEINRAEIKNEAYDVQRIEETQGRAS